MTAIGQKQTDASRKSGRFTLLRQHPTPAVATKRVTQPNLGRRGLGPESKISSDNLRLPAKRLNLGLLIQTLSF